MNDTTAVAKAVAFAEDAFSDMRTEFLSNGLSDLEYMEVYNARQQVRRIAAAGTPAQESP